MAATSPTDPAPVGGARRAGLRRGQRRGRAAVAAAVAVDVAALLGSCASGGGGGSLVPVGADVAVRLGDYEITMPGRISAATRHLRITNDGTLQHEVRVLRTDLSPGDLARVVPTAVPSPTVGLGGVEQVAAAEAIAPGEQRVLDVTLVPGRYLVVCNLPTHYAHAMYQVLVVA